MAKDKSEIDQSGQSKHSVERKKLLNQEMDRCLSLLREHGSPEKVILFGTLATGSVHEWSDIDLVVVERTPLPFSQRIKKVRKLLQPKVGMDIMVYTPEEFDQLCADRPFFKEEIIGKGEIVYERPKPVIPMPCQVHCRRAPGKGRRPGRYRGRSGVLEGNKQGSDSPVNGHYSLPSIKIKSYRPFGDIKIR